MPKNPTPEKFEDDELLPSKSEIKREAAAFQDVGRKIVELPNKNLARIPMWEQLEEAIVLARRLPNRDAKRRQIRFIAKILRNGEHEAITAALTRIEDEASLQNHRFHSLEKLRDDLLGGNDSGIQTAIEKYPNADRTILRQLVRNARKETERKQPPKSARKLFTYLRDLDNNK